MKTFIVTRVFYPANNSERKPITRSVNAVTENYATIWFNEDKEIIELTKKAGLCPQITIVNELESIQTIK